MPSSMMRRGIAGGLIVVGAFLVAVMATPWLLSSQSLQDAFVAEAQRRTGLDVRVDGAATATAFPFPAVRLSRVQIGKDQTGVALVRADEVVGSLRLWSLLRGEIVFSGYHLRNAMIRLPVVGSGSQTNWDEVLDTSRRLADDKTAGVALPEVTLENGTLEMVDAEGRVHFDMTAMSLAAGWPGIGHSAEAEGSGQLMGEATTFKASIASPSALALGKKSGFTLKVAAPVLSARFDGELTAGHKSVAEGSLNLETPSLKAALNWLQRRVPVKADAPDAFSVKGQATMSNGVISVSDAKAVLDGNAANGALSIAEANGRLAIRATLDAARIDVTPYFSEYSPAAANDQGGWNRKPIDFTVLQSTDLDMRLSAQQLVFGSVTVQDAAAIAIAREGRLTITLGEAKAHGGTIKGGVIVAAVKDQPMLADVNGDFALQDVQLGQGLAEWFGLKRLQGKGTIRLGVAGRGDSVQTLMRSLSGRGKLSAANGQINGIDVEAVLSRLERKPLSAAAGIDTRSGHTPYDTLNSDVVIEGGVATTQNVVLESPSVRVTMGGSLILPTREIDMRGNATLKRGKGETAFDLPFMVRSTWDDPFFLPDGDNLIRRSSAAGPLRDVTRDRDNLRAVQDAINRAGAVGDALSAPALSPQLKQFQALP